jgi:hypothetical protein
LYLFLIESASRDQSRELRGIVMSTGVIGDTIGSYALEVPERNGLSASASGLNDGGVVLAIGRANERGISTGNLPDGLLNVPHFIVN